MKLHAFVAMPFGKKTVPDGTVIDFNAVYEDLLKPAIENAGLEVFRADEEQAAGDIKTDMFQELLIAYLVVADLTLDNPNDAETWALLGRIDKDAWVESWKNLSTIEERREEAAYQDALLGHAITSYSRAFRQNSGHY